MGRPRELSEEEREALRKEGFRPVEVWLPDIWSDEVWEQVYKDCELIRGSEEEADVNLWIEEAARETMRLINEMEEDDK
ncbi:antitoxin MazE-like protein [Mesorhizobium xinjiangense]|uniref:antitoxin MazE-like protein n=1 Tax=Mesorhizobium xinjiangense TaxID=2678685 RepID=UPI0012EDB2F6|nr:antitoxin MazE-like protein [Mesorhizobium xinjiangense]